MERNNTGIKEQNSIQSQLPVSFEVYASNYHYKVDVKNVLQEDVPKYHLIIPIQDCQSAIKDYVEPTTSMNDYSFNAFLTYWLEDLRYYTTLGVQVNIFIANKTCMVPETFSEDKLVLPFKEFISSKLIDKF